MDRFQHIVRFSIFGHVHLEIYGVAHSFENPSPIGVHYWAGSVSSWYSVNPSFRMFEVDLETMLPVKVHTYVMNIREEVDPKWKYDHEVTELYNMTDLSPESFAKLSHDIKDNEQLAILYQKTMSSHGNQTDYDTCDEACRLNLYCSTMNTVYFESK